MKKNLNIYDELNNIVEAMKTPVNIISISEVSGVSTVITDSVEIFNNLCEVLLLTNGMIVTINDINYQVSNVVNIPSVKSFDITEASAIAESEWSIGVNFQTGTSIEVNEILNSESGNLNRFPLMWLLPPANLDYNHLVLDFTVDLTIVFAHKSNDTDRTVSRINNNFNPIIQPLQALFNKWLQSSDYYHVFEFNGFGKPIDFDNSDFAFFGNADKTQSVITTLPTDAKQIEYSLNFKKQYD